MSLSTGLSTLKAGQLKYAAFLAGLPNTGTKAQIEAALQQRLNQPWPLESKNRILSIDMGIKNLGICILEPQSPERHPQSTTRTIHVSHWKSLNLLSRLHPKSVNHSPSAEVEDPTNGKTTIDATAFHPSNLSKTAVSLVHELLQTYKPTHILIERQRFRSGGMSAVQEWTLRVNMLESMLWATFEALRQHSRKGNGVVGFPGTWPVDPARVARFWCARPERWGTEFSETELAGIGEMKPSAKMGESERKRSIDKKEKIARVRSWLLGADVASASAVREEESTDKVSLQLSPEAREVAGVFTSTTAAGRRKSTSPEPGAKPSSEITKLDDLADSMLQGVAWIRWADNLQTMRGLLQDKT